MGTDTSGFAEAWRRANDILLAPLVVCPNLGLAAVNAMVGATARLAERAVQATEGAFGPSGELAERVSSRVAERALGAAKASTDFALQAVRNAASGMAGEPTGLGSNQLLSQTLIDKTTATAALPLLIGWETVLAAGDVQAVRDAVHELWIDLSVLLDSDTVHGVMSGRQRAESDFQIRFSFYYMATEGPLGAVWEDFHGVVGGILALGLGDFQWLDQGARRYWGSMEYVYDKWLVGETQPKSDFPISALLAWEARRIVQRFPWPFVHTLRSGDPLRILTMLRADAGELVSLVSLYPFTAFQVTYDVLIFVLKAWLQVGDSIDYALCELAIADSGISDTDKELAMSRLRETAGKATVEFEYYAPLLVPRGGNAAEQAYRTSFTGQRIDLHAIAPSVFQETAIRRAQQLDAEVIQLRAFLWLYRDEATARRKSYQETLRKFGQAVADRIEQAWRDGTELYPLSPQDIAELTRLPDGSQGGPRSPQEINEVLYNRLHLRGLLYVAELVCGKRPFLPAISR